MAPGNFNRAVYEGASFNVFKALWDSILTFGYAGLKYVKNFSFDALIIFFFFIGIIKAGRSGYDRKIITICMISILTTFIMSFPVTFGYGTYSGESSRILFALDIPLCVTCALFVFCIGCIIGQAKKIRIYHENRILIILAVLFVCSILAGIKSNAVYRISYNLYQKKYENYYNEYGIMFSGLENYADGSDVILYDEDIPEDIDTLEVFFLAEDKEHGVNLGIADYFGLNSIRKEKSYD